MLFNSLQFLLFFIVVTLTYFGLKWRGRWMLLLVASCYFYMVLKPEYILILFLTIVIDYIAGIWIEKSSGPARRWLLILSLISNLGILAFFKYLGCHQQLRLPVHVATGVYHSRFSEPVVLRWANYFQQRCGYPSVILVAHWTTFLLQFQPDKPTGLLDRVRSGAIHSWWLCVYRAPGSPVAENGKRYR